MANSPLSRPVLSYVTLAVSLACQVIFVVLYLIRYDAGPSFTEKDAQVLVLGTLMTAGSLVSFFVEARTASRITFMIRYLLYLALCIPHPSWFDVRLFILAAMVFETGIYEPFPANIAISVAIITVSFITLELIGMFRLGVIPATISQALLFLTLPLLIAITAGFLTRFREQLIEGGNDIERLNIAVHQLSNSNLLLQEAAFRAAEVSRSSERHRVAREIHDTVGYTLTNLIMMMEAATDLVFDNPEELQRIMQAARDQAKSGLEETRRSLRELRAQEEQPIQGVAAIEKLISSYDNVKSVQVEAEYGNSPMSFGEEIDSALFHFVQEGLTNALRHGKATQIRIRLWVESNILTAIVRDNGRGAAAISDGIGLSGMKERAERLGGSVLAGNVADGFQSILTIPAKQPAKENRGG